MATTPTQTSLDAYRKELRELAARILAGRASYTPIDPGSINVGNFIAEALDLAEVLYVKSLLRLSPT